MASSRQLTNNQLKTRVTDTILHQFDQLAAQLDLTRSQLLRDCIVWVLTQQPPQSLMTADPKHHRKQMQLAGYISHIQQELHHLKTQYPMLDSQALDSIQQLLREAFCLLIGLPSDDN